jgi:hypothetical protein
MELIVQRVRERISGMQEGFAHHPVEASVALIGNLLPLKGEQEQEMRAWMAFSSQAQYDPSLKHLNDEVFDQTRSFVADVLMRLQQEGCLGASRTIADEIKRLHSLIDGLTLHRLTRPEVVNDETALDDLRAYIESLSA